MTIGTATVASLAAQVLQSGTTNLLAADGSSPYFAAGSDPTNIIAGAINAMKGLGLSALQINLVVATLANSPTAPWTSATSAATKLAAVQALVAKMQATSQFKPQGFGANAGNPAVNLLIWSVDNLNPGGVSGGDLNLWLGANVS